MDNKKLKEKEQELREQEELILKTVTWWENEVAKNCLEFDKLWAKREEPGNQEKLDALAAKFEELARMGLEEEKNLDQFEKKLMSLIGDILNDEEKPPKKRKKKK